MGLGTLPGYPDAQPDNAVEVAHVAASSIFDWPDQTFQGGDELWAFSLQPSAVGTEGLARSAVASRPADLLQPGVQALPFRRGVCNVVWLKTGPAEGQSRDVPAANVIRSSGPSTRRRRDFWRRPGPNPTAALGPGSPR
jgi:hypothetical protein